MTIRKRLKEMELRLTELCDYMQVSRPTMYKYIESYDNKEFKEIDSNVLKVFNYINDNKLAGKKNVVNYILNNLVVFNNESDIVQTIKNYVNNNPTSNKTKFFELLAKCDDFDQLIVYLEKIKPLIKKTKLTAPEKQLIKPYIIIKGE